MVHRDRVQLGTPGGMNAVLKYPGAKGVKTTGTPCGSCSHFSDGKCPIADWCISNEDIALSVMNPKHPVDFTRYEPKKDSI